MVKLESRRELASNSLSPRKTSAARKSAEPSNQLGAGHYVRSHDIDVSERRDKDICKRIIANNYTVHAIKKISNLQLSVESALHCFGFFYFARCDWPLSRQITFKTKTNRNLATCVFPRFRRREVFSCHWLPVISHFPAISFCDNFCLVLRLSVEMRLKAC